MIPPGSQLGAKALVAYKNRMVNAMAMFRPTVAQERFFRAMAASHTVTEVAVTGRNRGGKSVSLAVWFASVVMDVPVTMRNGEKLHMRPERWRGEELLVWLVGYDWKHNGETLYRLLFRPGLFKIIQDPKTGLFRSFDPTNPLDVGRENQRRPSPPLIPESVQDLESRSWESRKDRQLQSVTLKKDGTRLVFYASTGEVAAGNPVHVIWVDEKISSDSYYPEWLMRLVDYQGRIVWSSWPTLSPSGAFAELLGRADDQKDQPNPRALSFQFRKGDNPYTENETLDYALSTMSDEEAAARGDGESNISRWLIYPRFSPDLHRAYGEKRDGDDLLARVLRENNGMPPSDWTRYGILDPGNVNCAFLKIAIPPPSFGTIIVNGEQTSAFVVAYKEYYFHYKTAAECAEIIAADSEGEVFEDITCDAHAYRITPMGMAGTTVGRLYEDAFIQWKLTSNRRGTSFSLGGDDVAVRQANLNGWMNIRPVTVKQYQSPTAVIVEAPRLRIVAANCPVLIKHLGKMKRKKDQHDQPMDVMADHQQVDMAVALEYAAIKRDLIYVPVISKTPETMDLKSIATHFQNRYGGVPARQDSSIYIGAGAPRV